MLSAPRVVQLERVPSPSLHLLWRPVRPSADHDTHLRRTVPHAAQSRRAEREALRPLPTASMCRMRRAVHPSTFGRADVSGLAVLPQCCAMGQGASGQHRGTPVPGLRVVRCGHHGIPDRRGSVLSALSGPRPEGAQPRAVRRPPASAYGPPADRADRMRRPPRRVAAHPAPGPRAVFLLRSTRPADNGTRHPAGARREAFHRQCCGSLRPVQFVEERFSARRMAIRAIRRKGKNPIGKG